LEGSGAERLERLERLDRLGCGNKACLLVQIVVFHAVTLLQNAILITVHSIFIGAISFIKK